jgi:hypothetical protein
MLRIRAQSKAPSSIAELFEPAIFPPIRLLIMQTVVPNDPLERIKAFWTDLHELLERLRGECEDLTTNVDPELPEHRFAQALRGLSSMASKFIPISQATSEYVVKVVEADNDLLQNKSQAFAGADEKRVSNPHDPRYEDDVNRLSFALETFNHNLRELYETRNTEVAELHQQIVRRHDGMTIELQLESLPNF